ncbi:MAG TPA: KamA family radical SAM protein [Desulfobacteraceae bacterium]|nr:KamA family radical SAM protein [Desulfobacteraceae bacterium]HPJ66842.1 KamA family radical SAM protein [Desulfobacteraceae bacterium]
MLNIIIKKEDSQSIWKQILSKSITSTKYLPDSFEIDTAALQKVSACYPMRINPYFLSLIQQKDDPIYRQCIPDLREITIEKGLEDPLSEENYSPVPGLTHRYPDRVLFLISSQCAMYCRFCNRKRKVGRPDMVTKESIREGISYIRHNSRIRDVLLSGGDPLLLGNHELYDILNKVRSIPHVEIIRIGTRVPCTLPQRITPRLTNMLKKFHPLFINTHFNHPLEITPESSLACKRLADAGIPLGCQTVLLKGINDDLHTMKTLNQKLLTIRVRPYYLFQADLAKGTAHFFTPLKKGLEIMAGLHGHTSGMCAPHFAIDLPGGGGKVPLLPEYIAGSDRDNLVLRNYLGEEYRYPLDEWI